MIPQSEPAREGGGGMLNPGKRPFPGGAAVFSARRISGWMWSVALPALLAASAALPASLAAQQPARSPAVEENRKQIRKLGQEKSEIQYRISRFQASEKEMRSEIAMIAERVRNSRYRALNLKRKIKKQTAITGRFSWAVRDMERKMIGNRERIGRRLRRVYLLMKKSRTMTLFEIARIQTLDKGSVYLSRMQDADREAIFEYRARARRLIIRREEMRDRLRVLLALKKELETENRQLKERNAALRKSLSDNKEDRVLYRAYLADVKKSMSGMEKAVVNLEREVKRQTNSKPPVSPAKLKGTLPLPAKGKVIARFGRQDPRLDVKKRQRGIILLVKENTPVTAVAPGRVLHAAPVRGYQSLVVLDHGGGLLTVYGHLENLTVRKNATVRQGERLGQATYQPVSRDFNVYFEVRYKGKPSNPVKWLRRGQLRYARVK